MSLDSHTLNLFYVISFSLALSWKENTQSSKLPILFLQVQMSFCCPYLAIATSARVLPHSSHFWTTSVCINCHFFLQLVSSYTSGQCRRDEEPSPVLCLQSPWFTRESKTSIHSQKNPVQKWDKTEADHQQMRR